MSAGIIILLLMTLALIIGWHFIFPLVGGVIAFTALAWGVLVASVVIFCAAILLVFIFTGTGIFILGTLVFIWLIIAVVFFPLMFPIVFPLFVLFLVVSYFLRRRKKRKEMDKVNLSNTKPPLSE